MLTCLVQDNKYWYGSQSSGVAFELSNLTLWPFSTLNVITPIQGDNKLCERLHKFVDKKLIIIQKLNSTTVKSNSKSFFFFFFSFPMQVQYVLHMLPYTHQDDIWLRTKHFAIKADQFLQFFS
jgi:hypothetical protein